MSVFDQPTSSYPSFPATATTPEFLPTPSQQQAFPSDPFTPIQPVQQQPTANNDSSNYEPVVDEKPLLEELGINFYDIMKRSILVLNPFNKSNSHLLEEKDLSGPLFFCLSLYVYYILLHCRGVILLLRAKELRFGYIYGFGLLDCIFIYFLLNVMRKENTEMHRYKFCIKFALTIATEWQAYSGMDCFQSLVYQR